MQHPHVVLSTAVCSRVQDGLGSFGLNGLDKLLSFTIVAQLKRMQTLCLNNADVFKLLAKLRADLLPLSAQPKPSVCDGVHMVVPTHVPHKVYTEGVAKLSKFWSALESCIFRVCLSVSIAVHMCEGLT